MERWLDGHKADQQRVTLPPATRSLRAAMTTGGYQCRCDKVNRAARYTQSRRYMVEGKRLLLHTPQTVLDPICGTSLSNQQSWATYTYIGQEYRFCSQDCYEMFRRAPEYYIVLLAHDERGHCGLEAASKKSHTAPA